MELACDTARPKSPRRYQRRCPDKTVLHQVVRENLETLLEEGSRSNDSGVGYPKVVEKEFRSTLECGLLQHGFARVECADCSHEQLVAFSCKGRSLCPSCVGRKMKHAS